MTPYLRPPDDVYWHFRRLPPARQVGAVCVSREDGYTYRLREDRRICRLLQDAEGNLIEQETIDSIPLRLPAGAHVLTGAGWGFHMHISTFYQQIIAPSGLRPRKPG